MDIANCLLLVSSFICLSLACTPPDGGPMTLIEKVYHLPGTIYGRVLSTLPDPRYDYGTGSGVFFVEFEVFCIIKGDTHIASRLNISNGGTVPGFCHSTQFTVGNDYIVFVREEDAGSGQYTFDETQVDATAENLQQMSRVCGSQLQPPPGAAESNPACPVAVSAGQCIHDMHDEHSHDHEHYDDMAHEHEHEDHEGHDHAGDDAHDHDHDGIADHDHEGHDHDDGHDHEDHEGHDHEGDDPHDHDHDGTADHDHEDHDDGHDHEDHDHEDHEGHDHEGDDPHDHDHDGIADHDHEEHDHDDDHDHEDHEGHEHEGNDPHDHDHDGTADHSHQMHGHGHASRFSVNLVIFVIGLLSICMLL